MMVRINITVGLLLFCMFSLAQTKTSRVFYLKTAPCPTQYLLDSSGVFFKEVACEEAVVSYGTYKIYNNKVEFKLESFKTLPAISSITESKPANDTLAKITFLSRDGKFMPPATFPIDAIETSGNFYKRIYPNELGEILINPVKYKKLRLNYLDHFYTDWVYLEIKPADMIVTLTLPKSFFHEHHPLVNVERQGPLIIKPDGLFDVTGHNKIASAVQ